MAKRLPPLHALEAFEAAARLMSFKAAAAELHLTPSAISHRVKTLELHLGLALFRRLNREIRLTEAGHDYFASVRRAFDEVARASDKLRQPGRSGELRVSMVPYFASSWVIPNLEGFLERQPGLRLFVESTQRNADFGRDAIDAAVRYGSGRWPGLAATKLTALAATPVAAPRLLARHALRKPADLREHTLIHLTYLPEAWPRWLALAGVPGLKPKREIWVDNLTQAADAAERGVGVALGLMPLIAPRLAEQRILLPFDAVMPFEAFWFVCRRAEANKPALAALRDWLAGLMAEARDQMSQIHPKPRR